MLVFILGHLDSSHWARKMFITNLIGQAVLKVVCRAQIDVSGSDTHPYSIQILQHEVPDLGLGIQKEEAETIWSDERLRAGLAITVTMETQQQTASHRGNQKLEIQCMYITVYKTLNHENNVII